METYPVGLLPMQAEPGVLMWFSSAPLPLGYWMLVRACGGIFETVVAVRDVGGLV